MQKLRDFDIKKFAIQKIMRNFAPLNYKHLNLTINNKLKI